eukprot:431975_1
MLYTIIKYVSASIFLIIGRHSTNGGYIEPNITIDQDIDCGDAYNDTCIINCALNFDEANWTTARIPHVYCGNTTKCVIHCSANYCLRDSYIHANHTTHLDILSHGGNGCFQSSQLYLPNHGNATIIGHTNRVTNHTLNDLQIYSGTHTNRIDIQCHDSIHSNTQNDCDSLQIHAQTAQYLSITINESSFSNSTIHCPQSSPLSPSCIINADDAQSTEHVHIYAPKGTPQDVIFHSNGDGVHTGTTITCLDGNYSSTNNLFHYHSTHYEHYATCTTIGTTSDGENTQGVMNRMKMTKSSSIRKRSASGNTDWNSANLRRRFKNIWIIIEIEMNHNQMYVFVGVYLKTKSKKKLRNTKLRERKSE